MSSNIIEVINLKKQFTTNQKDPGTLGAIKSLVSRKKVSVEAVKGVSFNITEGELVGFLGPNGAGKTTTLKMLSGILHPTSGQVSVMGHTPWHRNPQFLQQMSIVMGQKMQLWWDLPAWESLQLLNAVYSVGDCFERRVAELADMLEITHVLHTQVRRLSLGERMKCELLAALLHSPKVLFLDEPTIGLDVVSQKRIRDFLKYYNTENKATILLTSHYMQDVQELCERVVIIDHGQIVFDDKLQELVDRHGQTRLLTLTFTKPVDQVDLQHYGVVTSFDGVRVTIETQRSETTKIAAEALNNLPIADILIDEVDIESIIRDLFSAPQAISEAIPD